MHHFERSDVLLTAVIIVFPMSGNLDKKLLLSVEEIYLESLISLLFILLTIVAWPLI